MDFFSAQSVNELKKCGKRYDIKKEISNNLGSNIKFKSKSWEDIFKVICTLNNLITLIKSQNEDSLIAKIFDSESKDELKSIGEFKTLKTIINDLFENNIIISTNSWENLYKSISNIKELCNLSRSNHPSKANNFNDLYFKGEAEKYIFYLLELDGKQRLDKLGINKLHYAKKEIASKWRNNIAKLIHPDVCNHPNAEKAISELNDMYKEMIK